MEEHENRYEILAERQRRRITEKVIKARAEVIKQVKNAYDPELARCRYLVLVDGGNVTERRFTEAEFLRRAGIDKNTIKRDYHQASRRKIERLIRWVHAKCAPPALLMAGPLPNPSTQSATRPSKLRLVELERDALAERFAILELEHSEALAANRRLRREIEQLQQEVKTVDEKFVAFRHLLLERGAIETGQNVVPIK